jgi:hypothetical protein
LAAGTGKFTELLACRDERFSVLAVEPHDEMRQQLALKSLDNVAVANGLSTAMPAPDESVDAVFAAQVRSDFSHSMAGNQPYGSTQAWWHELARQPLPAVSHCHDRRAASRRPWDGAADT